MLKWISECRNLFETHVSFSLGMCGCVLGTQSCPTLCDPVDCSPPGSSVLGILQARRLEWVAISISRGSSWPRYGTQVSCIGRQVLYHPSHEGSPSLGTHAFYSFKMRDGHPRQVRIATPGEVWWLAPREKMVYRRSYPWPYLITLHPPNPLIGKFKANMSCSRWCSVPERQFLLSQD